VKAFRTRKNDFGDAFFANPDMYCYLEAEDWPEWTMRFTDY